MSKKKPTIQQIVKLKELLQHIKDIDVIDVDSPSEYVRVFKLDKEAIIPTKAHKTDAGFDLYSLENVTIDGGESQLIRTGIALEIPNEWVGLIWPRSGLAVKHGIDVLAGVIDSGYRGEIKVCLLNTQQPLPLFETKEELAVKIKKGDKIAQILFQRVPDVELIEVSQLSASDRGSKGFGSSG